MANDFFNFVTTFARRTKARAEAVNARFTDVESGFALLPAKARLYENRVHYCGTAGGTVNALTVTPTYTVALTDGLHLRAFIASPNTGAATLNPMSLGNIAVVTYAGAALGGGELTGFVDFVYYSTSNHFRITNPVTAIGSVSVNNNVKASATDATPGTLTDKLAAGPGVRFTNSGAASEVITIDTPAAAGVLAGTISSGSTQMTANGLFRITGGTGILPTLSATSTFVKVQMKPASGTTVTMGRNSQTIDGVAADDTYVGDGGPGIEMQYDYVSAGAVRSKLLGAVAS